MMRTAEHWMARYLVRRGWFVSEHPLSGITTPGMAIAGNAIARLTANYADGSSGWSVLLPPGSGYTASMGSVIDASLST